MAEEAAPSRNEVENQIFIHFVVKPNPAMLVVLALFGGLLLALWSAFGFLAHGNIEEEYVLKLNLFCSVMRETKTD